MIEMPTITKNTVPERTATVRRIDATRPPEAGPQHKPCARTREVKFDEEVAAPSPLSNTLRGARLLPMMQSPLVVGASDIGRGPTCRPEGLIGRRTRQEFLMGEINSAANERQRHRAPPRGHGGPFRRGRGSFDRPYRTSERVAFFRGRTGSRVPFCPDLDAEPIEPKSRLRRCQRIHGGCH